MNNFSHKVNYCFKKLKRKSIKRCSPLEDGFQPFFRLVSLSVTLISSLALPSFSADTVVVSVTDITVSIVVSVTNNNDNDDFHDDDDDDGDNFVNGEDDDIPVTIVTVAANGDNVRKMIAREMLRKFFPRILLLFFCRLVCVCVCV